MTIAETASTGAQYFKCALQVNPYAYLLTNNKNIEWDKEDDYNAAMVRACLAEGIDVVGLTDHHRVRASMGLQDALTEAGVTVLPGFEATASDGVHILVLFAEGTPEDDINQRISETERNFTEGTSTPGTLSTLQLLAKADAWEAVMIPAHVETPNGLLTELDGHVRTTAWTSPHLTAVGVTCPLDDIDAGSRAILEGGPVEYRRDHHPAIVMAKDVCAPNELAQIGAWSWIKMTTPSLGVGALRQAFLDPDSRIALPPADLDTTGACLTSMSWDGGFLDGVTIPLNEQFNVLIGGRGTGKSTVIESIRFVLDLPLWGSTDHQGFLDRVLRPGTKVTLGVRCCSPQVATYTIVRTVGTAPIVIGADGATVRLAPTDVLRHPEIFGQRDLAALADDAQGRDRLLHRFMQPDTTGDRRLDDTRAVLVRNRESLVDLASRKDELDAKVERIPSVEAKIARLKDAGLDQRLERKNRLATDGRIIARAGEQIGQLDADHTEIVDRLPIELAFTSDVARKDAAAPELLDAAEKVLATLRAEVAAPLTAIGQAVDAANVAMAEIRTQAATLEASANEHHQQALRDLQKDGIDASAYVALGSELDELRTARTESTDLEKEIAKARAARDKLLSERAAILSAIRKRKKKAAKAMRQGLDGRADVKSLPGQDRRAVTQLICRSISGRLDKVVTAIEALDECDAPALADVIRQGPAAIRTLLANVTRNQAERLAGCNERILLELEELIPGDHVEVNLNLAPPGEAPRWQPVEHLSTGQKATAMLLITLLDGEGPLVIDQPEDDLDNQFISEALVPLVRRAKSKRQVVFSTHNANIPVLGDAELIAVMDAEGSASTDGHGSIAYDGLGSIDDRPSDTTSSGYLRAAVMPSSDADGGTATSELTARKVVPPRQDRWGQVGNLVADEVCDRGCRWRATATDR